MYHTSHEKKRNQRNKQIFLKKFAAMAIGNVMEWFDFSCFGALIDVLAVNFFPSEANNSLMLLKALAVFGAAFLMRPVGGIIMGWIGDTFGRKRALEVSILLMLFPSFLIGCLPIYSDIGWTASFLLLVLRLLQGLAAGGELVGAFLYTLEAAEGSHRGFWGGACKASGNFGTTCGLGLVTLLRYVLTKQQLYSWGWRIPFWCGILFGTAGIYARSRLRDEAGGEGVEFEAARANHQIDISPLRQVLSHYRKDILITILVAALWGCAYYTTFIWLVYYLQDGELIGGEGVSGAWIINLCSNCLLVLCLPYGGWLGDLIGQQIHQIHRGIVTAMKLGISLLIIVALPAFILFTTRQIVFVVIGQTLLIFPVALFGANLPAYMVARFPVALRFSGVGVAYNIAHALFSSTAPIIQTSLLLETLPWQERDQEAHRIRPAAFLVDDPRLRPAYYLIFIALVAYLALVFGGVPKSSPLAERDQQEEEERLAENLQSNTNEKNNNKNNNNGNDTNESEEDPSAPFVEKQIYL